MHWPLRLLLLRHGQVESNKEMRYVGLRDEVLTELGEQQARALGESLAGLPIVAILSSPLSRAQQTAGFVAEHHGLEVQTESRLREQNFGEWDGMSHGEIQERDPELLKAFGSRDDVVPPDGESQITMQARVLDLVRELALDAADRPAEEQPRLIALVSHVGPIKATMSAALDISLMSGRRIFLDPATVSVVDWGETPILRLANGHAHLGWTQARWMTGDVAGAFRKS
jgi:broad specificity phosphatase PhoE